MYLIDNKIDFNLDNKDHIRQYERFIPSVPMKSGVFTDTGSRMRQNLFTKADGIVGDFDDTYDVT
jgi:hypothetical protein